jgi:tropinone reductase I
MEQRWQLDGRTALITGASRGIGLACAQALLERGADLILVARDEDCLDAVAEELRADFPDRIVHAFSADLSAGDGRLALLEFLRDQQLDVHLLINNVGNNSPRQRAMAITDADWDFVMQTNVRSMFELSRGLHPWLRRHGSSAIVNLASVSGLCHVRTGPLYGMSKAAVIQLTRNLACEWACDGIRVNAVAPWYTRTDRTASALADPDYLDAVLERTPLGRIAEPAEVAAAVCFLCLPAASFITGQLLCVDGGFSSFGF